MRKKKNYVEFFLSNVMERQWKLTIVVFLCFMIISVVPIWGMYIAFFFGVGFLLVYVVLGTMLFLIILCIFRQNGEDANQRTVVLSMNEITLFTECDKTIHQENDIRAKPSDTDNRLCPQKGKNKKAKNNSSSSPSSNESQPVNPKSHLLSNLNQPSSSSDYPKPDIVICTTLAENAASDVNSAEEAEVAKENDALLKDIENNCESSSSSSTSSSSSSEDEEDKEIEKIAKPASMEDLTPGTYIQFRDESTPVPDDDKALEEAIATEDIEVDELPKEDETLPMSGDPSMLEDEVHSLDADEMILDETVPVSEDMSIPGLEITTADDDDELNSRESSLNEAAQLESEEIPPPEESAILLEEEINVPQEEAAQIEDDSSTEEKTSPSSAVDA